VRIRISIVAALLGVHVASAQHLVLEPVRGLDLYMPVPESNPLDPKTVELGRQLFFDTSLSADGTLACASCHIPALAFSDGRAVPRGISGAEGTRSAPALLNRAWGESFFWDGRARTLEHQVVQPILSARELGSTQQDLEARTGWTVDKIRTALASYVRTIRSGDSRFDRYVTGDKAALSDLEQEGLKLFQRKARCALCHIGPNFSDEEFHNTGVAWRDGRLQDEGRFRVTGHSDDRGAFKTPTLREVARTRPYMHDGSIATLEEVVAFYSRGGNPNADLDPLIRPLDLTVEEQNALVAFLKSLNGTVSEGL
jgi:cytochrome c peroxidase